MLHGELTLEKDGWPYNHYTHIGLEWEHPHTYAISYTLQVLDPETNEYKEEEYFLTTPGNYTDNQNIDSAKKSDVN